MQSQIIRHEANAELREAYAVVERLSQNDSLTGVANRRCFDQWIVPALAEAAQTQRPLALLMIDVDQFKAYNDSRGHLAGDECLREVARVLSFMLEGGNARLARYGGEEFAVLLPDAGPADAEALAERLRRAVEARALEHPASAAGRVTISVGVAVAVPPPSADASVLVAPADAALDRAKRAGRNRVETAG